MKIFGLQKTTLLDFPGKVACTVFAGGCDLLCPFCQNAQLVIKPDFENAMAEDEILKFLSRRTGILDGVCLTGGEPLMQPDVLEFMGKVKSMGYALKLDTNGTFPKKLKEAVNRGLVDYVAMDIKNSLEKYPLTVGIESFNTDSIIESAKFLMQGNIDYEFRTTVVAEYHEKEDFYKIGEWLKGSPKYFLQCFEESENTIKEGLTAPTKASLEEYADICREYFNAVEIRGV